MNAKIEPVRAPGVPPSSWSSAQRIPPTESAPTQAPPRSLVQVYGGKQSLQLLVGAGRRDGAPLLIVRMFEADRLLGNVTLGTGSVVLLARACLRAIVALGVDSLSVWGGPRIEVEPEPPHPTRERTSA